MKVLIDDVTYVPLLDMEEIEAIVEARIRLSLPLLKATGEGMSFGALLRAYRLSNGLSLKGAAAAVGVTYQLIQRYENESTHPGFANAVQLSRVYGLPLEVMALAILPPTKI